MIRDNGIVVFVDDVNRKGAGLAIPRQYVIAFAIELILLAIKGLILSQIVAYLADRVFLLIVTSLKCFQSIARNSPIKFYTK